MARKLNVEIVGDASKLKSEFADASAHTEKFGSGMSKMAKVAVLSAGAAGIGALVVGLKSTIGAAMDAEKSQKLMEAQLKASGLSYKAHAAEIENVIQKTSRLAALDDEDLQNAFSALARTTGDVTRALKDTGLAADVARGKNISLEAATALVTKAELGKVGALTKAGIAAQAVTTAQDALKASGDKYTAAQMDAAKAADAVATKQALLATLQSKFAGAAEAYGSTAAGAQDRFRVAVENLQEAIGLKLLPIIASAVTRVAEWVTKLSESESVQRVMSRVVADLGVAFHALGEALHVIGEVATETINFFRQHQVATDLLKGAVVGLTAAIAVHIAIEKANAAAVALSVAAVKLYELWVLRAEVAQWALNAALAANPVGLVIVAVAALAVAFAVAWRNSETFRNVTTAAFNAVRNAVITVVDGVLRAFDLWLAAYEAVFRAASKIPGIGKGFEIVANAVHAARVKVDELRGAIDALHSKDIVITLHERTIRSGDPGLPGRQHGGPVEGGFPYLVGEGGPELFVPKSSGMIVPLGRALAGLVSGASLTRVNEAGAAVAKSFAEGFQGAGIKEALLGHVKDAKRAVDDFVGGEGVRNMHAQGSLLREAMAVAFAGGSSRTTPLVAGTPWMPTVPGPVMEPRVRSLNPDGAITIPIDVHLDGKVLTRIVTTHQIADSFTKTSIFGGRA